MVPPDVPRNAQEYVARQFNIHLGLRPKPEDNPEKSMAQFFLQSMLPKQAAKTPEEWIANRFSNTIVDVEEVFSPKATSMAAPAFFPSSAASPGDRHHHHQHHNAKTAVSA